MQTEAHDTIRAGTRPWASLLAATLVGLPLGSIYAFSVFLKPLEQLLGITRSEMSIVFGIATVCYTVGANITPYLFGRLPAPILLLLAGAISGSGMVLASQASSIIDLAVGYGLLFGIGGGLSFCVVQQCVNLLVRTNQGLVNGYLISLFPLGAMVAAPVFGWGIELLGVRLTLLAVGAVLALTGLIGFALIQLSGVRLSDAAITGKSGGSYRISNPASFWKVFFVFFFAAAAGLTMLSQAAGIVQAYGGTTAAALAATTVITASIAAARITGGWLVDRYPIPYVAVGAQIIALTGAILLTLYPSVFVCILAINMIGVGYGLISGVMAGSIAAYWQRNEYGRIASRMYVAWCIAAISLPIVAARFFDLTGGYHMAILLAGGCNLMAIFVGSTLPRRNRMVV